MIKIETRGSWWIEKESGHSEKLLAVNNKVIQLINNNENKFNKDGV